MLQQGSGDIRFAADLPRPGDPPLTRYVIIAFDDVQQAQTWWNSEEWEPSERTWISIPKAVPSRFKRCRNEVDKAAN